MGAPPPASGSFVLARETGSHLYAAAAPGGCFATPPPKRVRGGVFLANPTAAPWRLRHHPILNTRTHTYNIYIGHHPCRTHTWGRGGVAVCASAPLVYYIIIIRYNVCAPYKYLYSRRCTRYYVCVCVQGDYSERFVMQHPPPVRAFTLGRCVYSNPGFPRSFRVVCKRER